MNRNTWEFHRSAEEVYQGASNKHDHHVGRLAWWEDKKKEVVAKIRAEGIEIDESLADQISNSYNRGATVMIRVDLQQDLQECVGKIKEHRARAAEYAGWMEVLKRQGTHQYALHHDDWLYFFGNKS